jgi:glucose/arabinose dehydrogenase
MSRVTASTPLAATIAIVAAASACAQSGSPVSQGAPNVPDFEPAFPDQTRAPATASDTELAVETVAGGLVHPWGIAVTPAGDYLVTERPGRLRVIFADRQVSDPVDGLPEIFAQGQGGLLDVAVSPDFSADRTIYFTYSKPMGDGTSATAAARARISEDFSELTEVEDIFVQEPASPTAKHYGSRILFDDAGHAFITTGEHSSPSERVFAQDLDKTYGKVIRVNLDGSTPQDNPFVGQDGAVDTIWSYGHRNIQGADIRPETGRLWIIEHGPKGGDELNRIEPGANYGWPVISYGENYSGSPIGEGITAQEGMTQPRYYWDPVIAPGGMVFYDGGMFPEWEGDLLISSLLPGALVRLELDGETVVGEERLLTDVGRVRDVAIAPDGAVLALTDRDDGEVLRLTPETATN